MATMAAYLPMVKLVQAKLILFRVKVKIKEAYCQDALSTFSNGLTALSPVTNFKMA
jgi:hypothetical protein